MSTPENRLNLPSNFCQLGPRPDIMDGLFRLLLIEHFSDPDNVGMAFKTRLYKSGPTTGIMIEEATVWKPDETEVRPAVIIKEGDWSVIKRATLDGQYTITPEGYKSYIQFWQGSHTLFCLAVEGVETKLLAAEVYEFFNEFAPVFREKFGLLSFTVAQVGALSTVKESRKHYAKPITIGYSWDQTVVLRETAPQIKTIRLSQLFNLG